MGRPRRVYIQSQDGSETRPSRPFNPDEPCSTVYGEHGKYLAQGGAYYSYAEPQGPYNEKRMSRELVPRPKFMGWQERVDAEATLHRYKEKLKQRQALENDLDEMKRTLKKYQILEEDDGAPD